jgi:FdhD protein
VNGETPRDTEAVAAAPVRTVRCRRGQSPLVTQDQVAREEPLEIRIRGTSVAVTMRTPGHDAELAAGFLLTEGIVRAREDVLRIVHCPGALTPENTLNVLVAPTFAVDLARLTRHVFASSSCGLCGKVSIEAVHQHFPPITTSLVIAPEMLMALPARMLEAQATFAQTGGLHAAALFDAQGRLVVLREDVGRHNAVDKVLGHGFLEGRLPFDSHALLVSGRASFEIMQKALAARIPIVCALSAPSSLAVDFARSSGQTLVAFLGEERFNVYSCPERLQTARDSTPRRSKPGALRPSRSRRVAALRPL